MGAGIFINPSINHRHPQPCSGSTGTKYLCSLTDSESCRLKGPGIGNWRGAELGDTGESSNDFEAELKFHLKCLFT